MHKSSFIFITYVMIMKVSCQSYAVFWVALAL